MRVLVNLICGGFDECRMFTVLVKCLVLTVFRNNYFNFNKQYVYVAKHIPSLMDKSADLKACLI